MGKPVVKKSHYALCLKEFKFASVATMLYILCSCALCYVLGYQKGPGEVAMMAGIPVWVIFGIIVPWVAIVALTVIYGFFIMEGDDR